MIKSVDDGDFTGGKNVVFGIDQDGVGLGMSRRPTTTSPRSSRSSRRSPTATSPTSRRPSADFVAGARDAGLGYNIGG